MRQQIDFPSTLYTPTLSAGHMLCCRCSFHSPFKRDAFKLQNLELIVKLINVSFAHLLRKVFDSAFCCMTSTALKMSKSSGAFIKTVPLADVSFQSWRYHLSLSKACKHGFKFLLSKFKMNFFNL